MQESCRALRREDGAVRALYAGGTLAHEAILILEPLLGPIATNLRPGSGGRHRVTDLGADEYTVGRAHPMLDATVRVEEIRKAAQDPDVAVMLLDVVLGHGAAPDPAGDVAAAIEAARATAKLAGRGLAVVASVIGTAGDPQTSPPSAPGWRPPGFGCFPPTRRRRAPPPASPGGSRSSARLLEGRP